MMGNWKQELYSLVVCAFVCGLICQVPGTGKRKELFRVICGTVLAIYCLQPLSDIRWEDFSRIPLEFRDQADVCIGEGQRLAAKEEKRIIAGACEAYILDKAKELGAEIQIEISLNPEGLPVCAVLGGEADPETQRTLQRILSEDLGIPKENQAWIGNQENSSS